MLIDVAELDDISAVALMLLLFAMAPVLAAPSGEPVLAVAGWAAALIALKTALFGAISFLFARYFERPITDFLSRAEPSPDPLLPVVGIGLIIAAVAGLLGFSLALGALFAGIVFTRDPRAVRVDASFDGLYQLFVPFFFIGIGLQIDPDTLGGAAGVGGVLVAVAVLGKLLGAGLPALPIDGWAGAGLIGVSMVPRAEIALVVMQEGRHLGAWAVPDDIFSAMILVVVATCLTAPIDLKVLLTRMLPANDDPTVGKTDPTRD